jgi:hypothetical protein
MEREFHGRLVRSLNQTAVEIDLDDVARTHATAHRPSGINEKAILARPNTGMAIEIDDFRPLEHLERGRELSFVIMAQHRHVLPKRRLRFQGKEKMETGSWLSIKRTMQGNNKAFKGARSRVEA